jgi:hypothetical protein
VKRKSLYETALEIICEIDADEICPNELYGTDWPECAKCKNTEKNAVHYDPKKDTACFKRYYLEQARKRQAEELCGGGTSEIAKEPRRD